MKGPVLMVELVQFFGWRRASALLGLSALWGGVFPESLSERELMPDPRTEARYVADLRRFGRHLEERGLAGEVGADISELLTAVLANQQIAELGKRVASSEAQETSSDQREAGEHVDRV